MKKNKKMKTLWLAIALALAIAMALRRARPLSLYLAHLGLRPMLRDFDAICAAHGVVYWADSGTLLGAVRDGGIIAHDDDVDVCVPAASMQALCDAVRDHPEYAIWAEDHCYKFGSPRDLDRRLPVRRRRARARCAGQRARAARVADGVLHRR